MHLKLSTFAEQMAANPDILGPNLKAARKRLNLFQSDVAERAHVSKKAVGNWENGRAIPEWENLKRVARVLKVSVDDLLEDPDAPVEEHPLVGEVLAEIVSSQERIEAKLDAALEIFTTAEQLAEILGRREVEGGSTHPRLPNVRPPEATDEDSQQHG